MCAHACGGQRLTSGSIHLLVLRQGLSLGPDSSWLQGSYWLYYPRTELEIMWDNTQFFCIRVGMNWDPHVCVASIFFFFTNRAYVSSPFVQCGGLTADIALPLRTTPQSAVKLRSPSDFTACRLSARGSTCQNLTGISESFVWQELWVRSSFYLPTMLLKASNTSEEPWPWAQPDSRGQTARR